MTDHSFAAREHLTDLAGLRKEVPMVDYLATSATTEALLAIADAIRGLTPNAVQDAAGCPQNDPHPELGQVGRDGATGPARPRSTMTHLAEHDWQEYYETTETMVDLKTRAEKAEIERDHLVGVIDGAEQRTRMAEAERDAILTDLRNLRDSTFTDTRNALTEIISRHTPEG